MILLQQTRVETAAAIIFDQPFHHVGIADRGVADEHHEG